MSSRISFDIAIIGLGVTGSAALAALARRGLRAVGIDRFAPGHDRGSSHGVTRAIRLGYFEHPSYVPLVRAAIPLWRELEAQSAVPLMTVTGILEMGTPDSELVAGTLAASRLHGLPHEVLDAAGVRKRFPAFRLPDDFIGVFQPDGGMLRAEPAVAAFQSVARQAGAELRFEERITGLAPDGGGVRVMTERGAIYAGGAVVAAGPWLPALLSRLALPVRVTRQVLAWFTPARNAALFAAGCFPVFLIQSAGGVFYGFPADGTGVKIAKHHHFDEAVDPDTADRAVSAADEAAVRSMIKTHVPDAAGPLAAAKTCLYTMTPDGDFILDCLPECPRIVVASPCSGHGFKFAPATGEILADLATAGHTKYDISRFSLRRFAAPSSLPAP
jgi:sarcosine oxidase